jgi:hypothetical protein
MSKTGLIRSRLQVTCKSSLAASRHWDKGPRPSRKLSRRSNVLAELGVAADKSSSSPASWRHSASMARHWRPCSAAQYCSLAIGASLFPSLGWSLQSRAPLLVGWRLPRSYQTASTAAYWPCGSRETWMKHSEPSPGSTSARMPPCRHTAVAAGVISAGGAVCEQVCKTLADRGLHGDDGRRLC